MQIKRISVDQYFMTMTEVVSLRSTCLRHNFGCVIVNNGNVVSTGYNGAVKGGKHCTDIGCIRDKLGINSGTRIEICEAVHAEQNALIQAGKGSEGGTLYVNGTPCIMCSKLMINAGIVRVVVPIEDLYPDKDGIKLLRKIGIKVVEIYVENHAIVDMKVMSKYD